jgi:hypothetical protein
MPSVEHLACAWQERRTTQELHKNTLGRTFGVRANNERRDLAEGGEEVDTARTGDVVVGPKGGGEHGVRGTPAPSCLPVLATKQSRRARAISKPRRRTVANVLRVPAGDAVPVRWRIPGSGSACRLPRYQVQYVF